MLKYTLTRDGDGIVYLNGESVYLTVDHIDEMNNQAERIKELEGELDQQRFNNKHNLSIDQKVTDKLNDYHQKNESLQAQLKEARELLNSLPDKDFSFMRDGKMVSISISEHQKKWRE